MTKHRNAGDRNAAELLPRPLTARSAIASLLLGMDRPRMRGAELVRWCELFGIPEGTARVALTRMVQRGELRGRDGVYELVGRVRARQTVQEWSLDPELRSWGGEWQLGLVTAGARAAVERAELRTAMRQLRLAPMREGVWGRPDNLPREAATDEVRAVANAQVRWWRATPEPPNELGGERDADALFGVTAWRTRAQVLHDVLGEAADGLSNGDAEGVLADWFRAARAA